MIFLFTSAFSVVDQENDAPVIRITQVDTSRFPQVTVYVTVTDAAGNPLAVNPAQLTVSENNKPVASESVSGAGKLQSLTTMLVMDVSGSMGKEGKLDAAKVAALDFIQKMRPGDQAGLISYNTQVRIIQPVTDDTEKLRDAVSSLEPGGDTSMYDALIEAEFLLEPLPGRKAIILLTDGLDNHSRYSASDVIDSIGPSGLSISTIGLGNASQDRSNQTALDEQALEYLAQNAGGGYSYVDDPQGLQALYLQIARTCQSEFAITFISKSKLRDGLNRTLAISFTPTGGVRSAAPITANYNPGGLIPEVANPGVWGLFIGLLALLLVLLAAPRLIPVIVHRIKDRAAIRRSAVGNLSRWNPSHELS